MKNEGDIRIPVSVALAFFNRATGANCKRIEETKDYLVEHPEARSKLEAYANGITPRGGTAPRAVAASLEAELASLLNKFSTENGSDTPDFILAQYLLGCLRCYEETLKRRADWWASSRSVATIRSEG